MPVTIEKINQRLYRLNYTNPNHLRDLKNVRLVDESKNIFFENNAIDLIKHWESLSEDTNSAFEKALDAYDLMLLYGTGSGIKNSTNIIVSEVYKVRDADALRRSLKYRFGRLRKGITSNVGNNDVLNSFRQSINNLQNSLTSGKLFSKSSSPQATSDNEDKKDNNINECYRKIISEADSIYECDRIIRQYGSIHNRFNLDKLITEAANSNMSVYETSYKIAEYVDTFNSPFKNKYNTALESAWYGFNKHHISCNNRTIINAVTDYYLFNGFLTESELQDIQSVEYINPVFSSDDFNILNYMEDDSAETTLDRLDYINAAEEYGAEDMGSIVDSIKDLEESAIDSILKIKDASNPDIDEVTENLKMLRKMCLSNYDAISNIKSLKAFVDHIINHNDAHILQKVFPPLINIIHTAFVFGSDVHDIKYITEIIDSIEKAFESRQMLNQQEAEKILLVYDNEIDHIKSKQEKIEDGFLASRAEAYLNCITANRDSIKNYISDTFSGNEESENEDEESDGLNEAASIILISNLIRSLVSETAEDTIEPDIDMIINGNVAKFSNDTIDAITDFSITIPSIIDKEKLRESLIANRDEVRSFKNRSMQDYIRIDCLNNNISRLSEDKMIYNTRSDTKACIAYLMCLNELKCMDSNSDAKYFSEAMSFTNTLKLAANNLKRSAIKLSDKEKAASNTIDMAIGQITKSMDREMSAAERERIVRGQILPPASKCIKYALMFGVTWLVNPAVAVIGALGVYFTRKKSTMKERQMALDEIEVELKMCDRYIRMYEEQNDMQKLRQCEIIQRNLYRQQQRIRYKMKVDFRHADVSSVANVGGEDFRLNK